MYLSDSGDSTERDRGTFTFAQILHEIRAEHARVYNVLSFAEAFKIQIGCAPDFPKIIASIG